MVIIVLPKVIERMFINMLSYGIINTMFEAGVMVRPVKFNREKVLGKATQLFWSKGYQGTTMRDIGRATELNPGSLYGSFGKKRDIFFMVLEHYYINLTEGINQSLNSTDTNNAILDVLFQRIIFENNKPTEKGCLLVNCLLEMAHDRDIQARIAAMFSGFEEMFYWIILKGQKEGTYNPRLEPRVAAQYLVNNYFGLRVQCMTEKNSDQLKEVVNSYLSFLD